MDKFVVDIDAVLDEFEESENKIQPQITVLPQIKQQTTVVPVSAPSQRSEESPPTTPRLLKARAPPAPEPETDALVDGPKLNGTSDTAKSLNSIEVKSRESELDEAVETTLPEASESKSLLIQESEPVATTISQPPETTPESKPPETTPESKPAKTTTDSKPAETVAESKPVETVPESKPPETVRESKPAETVAESKPAETPEPKAAPTSDHQQTQKYQAVKPKTPMKTQSASPNCRTASPGVSSEQFDEFLRKKSIENAHLLSAHNSPVLQRYRSSSFGLSAKSTLKGTETPKLPEQSVGLPQGELAQKVSQNRDGTVEQVDDRTKPSEPKSQLQSRGETCTAAHVPSGEAGKAPSNHVHESSAAESEPQSRYSEQSERAQNAEKNSDQGSNRVSEATIKSDSLAQDAANDSINHGPLKSDASNFYRIVSFDMSAVEVTDDDLNLLEDEVHNGRAPSRRSQDSEASVEPVDPDQVIESEAAENVVNNNSMDAPNRIEGLDNPFDVKASDEVPVPSTEQLGDTGSETQNVSTTTTDDVGKQVAEIEEPSTGSPQPESESCDQDAAVNSDEAERGAVGGESEPVVAPSEVELGKVRPMWIHDEDAPICMNCGQDFTIFRRRHHCRACGKVLCGNCCKDRARLQFMDGELARVCSYCIEILNKVERWSRPDPSNPMEYCSTVSPLAQMSSTAQLPPPTVMVPVGVLKKGGEKSNTSGSGMGGTSGCSKSVMFSDGIRPGGDLTDLDIPSTPPAQRAPQRTLKQLATGRSKAVVPRKYRKYVSVADSLGCLPNVLLSNKFKPYDQPLAAGTLFNLLQDPTLPPVSFELTRHKVQLRVKIVTLDCCLGSRVWSFCSEGLAAFGQEEVAFVLEYHADDELAVPRDVLKLYKILYENACRGAPVIQMDHLLFPGGLLSSNEHAGVLFLRTTLQCTQNILTPLHESSYLVAMLILRSEVPWAKLFPLRLLLRLGAELRYYPCPLVSQRFRKAVYFDGDQHSIMSILADFRNYQYTIQNIPGLVIHVVGKTYTIKAPRNRYDLMMKASTTNENILAIGSNFSPTADSHLVCIQGEDGSFQSQTINIASLPVKVTGASFLVFSGALKSNSGYTAKSSIVEDGILVQIGPHDMAKLKQAIHAMENYRIVCKETKSTTETTDTGEEEYVELLWVENEVTRNESVISVVDGSSMAGIPSCKIFSGTDYSNDKFVVRWTELFFLASKDTELDLPDPNRLIEATARSMCVALLPHAAKLYERDLKKVALRISLDPEQFGYELGAGGERLNGEFLSEVDNALVPIITSLDGSHQPMTIELVFYVLLK